VFDPPPDLPAIPLTAIVVMVGAIVAGLGLSLVLADRGMQRLEVVAALRER
jgi:hypothetical protein